MKELIFERTCEAAPEQYDVMLNGKQVAYVRLRWGHLSVRVPDETGDVLYSHNFGDKWQGYFREEQREKYLKIIEEKLKEHLTTMHKGSECKENPK